MSTDIYNVVIGAIGSILATIVIFLVARLYFGWKTWPGLKKTIRFTREYISAGGVNFFSSRKSYFRNKDHGTASEYIKNAQSSLIYVGFWLAHGTEVGNITETIKGQLESGKKVTIVLLNPESDVIIHCSKFLGIQPSEVKIRILNTLNKLTELKNSLSNSATSNLEIRVHDIPISSSAFLLDSERGSGGRILIDSKLFGFTRDDSFGMEFREQGKPLYDRFSKSFISITETSKPYSS